MTARLFEQDRLQHGPRSRCTDLVPLPRAVCHRCGGPISYLRIGELALLRHGGYGATRQTTFEQCLDHECRTVRVAAIDEVSPRR